MRNWQQPLAAGASDRYAVTVENWLDGDAVVSASWSGAGVTVSSQINTGATVSALLSVASASACPVAVDIVVTTAGGRSLELRYGLVVVDSLTP